MLWPTRKIRNSANMVIESPLSRSTRRMWSLRSRAGEAGGHGTPPPAGQLRTSPGARHIARVKARPTGMDPDQRPFRVVHVLAEHVADPPPAQLPVDGMEAAPDRLVLPVGDPELLPPRDRHLLLAPVLAPHPPGALLLDAPDDVLVLHPQLPQQPAGPRRPRQHQQGEQVVQGGDAPVALDRVLLG